MTHLLVSYLSLRARPADWPERALPAGLEMVRNRLGVEEYLGLYRDVGAPWGWDQRERMSRKSLAAFLAGPDSDIYVLRDGVGRVAGFCEFDSSGYPDIQLMNFGLMPDVFGRGWGLRFLLVALREVWAERNPRRIWLHTDTQDHPKARETYLRAGFSLDVERWEDVAEL